MQIQEMEKAHALQLLTQEEKAGENFCDMEDALNGTIEELEEKIQELNKTIETTTASKQEKESELELQIEKLKSEKDTMLASFEEKEQTYLSQLKGAEAAQAEKECTLNEKIDSLTNKVTELEAESEKVDGLTAKITELEAECEEIKRSYEEELSAVHAQIKEKSELAQAQLGKCEEIQLLNILVMIY